MPNLGVHRAEANNIDFKNLAARDSAFIALLSAGMSHSQKNTTKDTKSTKVSEDISLDAVLPFGHVKVDQQVRFAACQFHVGQQLSLVDPLDLFDGLQLDNQIVFDQQVDAMSSIKSDAFMLDRLGMLPVERYPVEFQFVGLSS